MKSIVEQLNEESVWEEFLTYRLLKGRFQWIDFEEADSYVAQKQYKAVAQRIGRGEGLSIPTRHLVNKMGSQKKRVVYSFDDEEMKVLKCMSFLLYRYDKQLSDNLYSFRHGLSAHDALRQVLNAIDHRPMWAYKMDIHNYFNSISIPLLLPTLRKVLADDEPLYRFLEQVLTDGRAIMDGKVISEQRGVMAGTPFSPFLANIYLMEVDRYFAEAGVVYARYSDDIILFAPDRETLDRHIDTLMQLIAKYRLEVNPDKVRIYSPDEAFDFLGFKCHGRTIDICDATKRKIKDKIHRKARAIVRWQAKKGVPAETAAKVFIRYFNEMFFESESPTLLNWSRWFFPLITTDEGLKEIDHFMQDHIRYVATGRWNKARFRVRYEMMREMGYRGLRGEFFKGE